jgi:hypothetical protein
MFRIESKFKYLGFLFLILGILAVGKMFICFSASRLVIKKPAQLNQGQPTTVEFNAEKDMYYEIDLDFSDVYPLDKMADLLGIDFKKGKNRPSGILDFSWKLLSGNSVVETNDTKPNILIGTEKYKKRMGRVLYFFRPKENNQYSFTLNFNKTPDEFLIANPQLSVLLSDTALEDYSFKGLGYLILGVIFSVIGLVFVFKKRKKQES